MGIVGRDELEDGPLGVYPAQRMEQDVKLAGVVAENNQIRIDGPVFQDTPQQGCLGNDSDMLLDVDAPRFQSDLPLRMILKDGLLTARKEFQLPRWKAVLFHVIEGRIIEHIVLFARPQH